MNEENITAFIENHLARDWDHYANLISFHSNGANQFHHWLESKEWLNSLSFAHQDGRMYAPLVILLSFSAVRKRMIANGFFSLRKLKLEGILQRLLTNLTKDSKECIKFIYNKPNLYASLKEIIENMKHKYNVSFLELESIDSLKPNQNIANWLTEWMTRPHMPKYKQFYEELTEDEDRKKLMGIALDSLRQQSHHPHVKRVFYRLLIFHECYEEGVRELLKTVSDPLYITPEERDFLAELQLYNKREARPLLHHFVERLIEKKAKAHYTEAINYILLLQQDYSKDNQQEYFSSYIHALKSKYSRFLSFVKELSVRVH